MKPFQIVFLLVLIGLIIALLLNQSSNPGDIDRSLLEAVKGNKGLAKRLLNQAKDKYPGKSERWYVEKVIYDLERDRAGSRGRSSSYRFNQSEMRENIFLISAVLGLVSYVSTMLRGWLR
ncbi:MAG: hypothetical protein M3O33_20810 [Cyanobacteriota bacterium]|nr:hypothetical protein [Cyanobacteriota bacterium]